MKYSCETMAKALRAQCADCDCGPQGCGMDVCQREHHEDGQRAARAALAAFDAEPELWDDLLHAARAVVDNWSTGDLAGAVRELAACVVALDGDA